MIGTAGSISRQDLTGYLANMRQRTVPFNDVNQPLLANFASRLDYYRGDTVDEIQHAIGEVDAAGAAQAKDARKPYWGGLAAGLGVFALNAAHPLPGAVFIPLALASTAVAFVGMSKMLDGWNQQQAAKAFNKDLNDIVTFMAAERSAQQPAAPVAA